MCGRKGKVSVRCNQVAACPDTLSSWVIRLCPYAATLASAAVVVCCTDTAPSACPSVAALLFPTNNLLFLPSILSSPLSYHPPQCPFTPPYHITIHGSTHRLYSNPFLNYERTDPPNRPKTEYVNNNNTQMKQKHVERQEKN